MRIGLGTCFVTAAVAALFVRHIGNIDYALFAVFGLGCFILVLGYAKRRKHGAVTTALAATLVRGQQSYATAHEVARTGIPRVTKVPAGDHVDWMRELQTYIETNLDRMYWWRFRTNVDGELGIVREGDPDWITVRRVEPVSEPEVVEAMRHKLRALEAQIGERKEAEAHWAW